MDSEALVQLALNTLSCLQKELAVRLGVSPTQISKWKKGEHMSLEMQNKFREITQIGEKDPSFVLWAGSLEEASKWEGLIRYLAKLAQDGDETGYHTYPLDDELGTLCWHTFQTLIDMGVDIPKELPQELDIDYEVVDCEDIENLIGENPYSALIYEIYKSLTDVYGFYAAYVNDLLQDDDLELFDTPAENIEPCLINLAASKIDANGEFAPRRGPFRQQVMKDYKNWLNIVKDRAFRAGRPLKAELLDLVYDSAGKLGHEAEAESLGVNSSRIHPDIYINELLVGMRVIHQVLPAIMEKLGIDKEFTLDTSELRIS